MSKDFLVVGLIALAGILVGGVYSTYKTAKVAATILGLLAALCLAGAIAWYSSS